MNFSSAYEAALASQKPTSWWKLVEWCLKNSRWRDGAKCFGYCERFLERPLLRREWLVKAKLAEELGLDSIWAETIQKALGAKCDGDPNVLSVMLKAAADSHLLPEQMELFKKLLSKSPQDTYLFSSWLFQQQYRDRAPEVEAADIKSFNRLVEKIRPLSHFPQREERPQRLRIGYVGPDFYYHPTNYFIEGPLREHDRERFEIHIFHTSSKTDLRSDELAELADHWHLCGEMDDRSLAEFIRREKVDILIDVTGHMRDGRVGLFPYRCAPLQGIWIGWLCAMGLESCDFRISDWQADPDVEEDELCLESVARSEAGIFHFTPPQITPALCPPPFAQNGFVTFGSFNNGAKQNEDVLNLWAGILQEIPNSRLILKHRSYTNHLVSRSTRAVFEKAGIASERVSLLAGIVRNSEHLAAYSEIDICLDPFPYNGVTSTCEALLMGVPVVVLKGRHHRSRIGVSLLTQMGLMNWIAETPEDYVKIACTAAKDRSELLRLRKGLRNLMSNCPLGDARLFTQGLEQCFDRLWEERISETD